MRLWKSTAAYNVVLTILKGRYAPVHAFVSIRTSDCHMVWLIMSEVPELSAVGQTFHLSRIQKVLDATC